MTNKNFISKSHPPPTADTPHPSPQTAPCRSPDTSSYATGLSRCSALLHPAPCQWYPSAALQRHRNTPQNAHGCRYTFRYPAYSADVTSNCKVTHIPIAPQPLTLFITLWDCLPTTVLTPSESLEAAPPKMFFP